LIYLIQQNVNIGMHGEWEIARNFLETFISLFRSLVHSFSAFSRREYSTSHQDLDKNAKNAFRKEDARK